MRDEFIQFMIDNYKRDFEPTKGAALVRWYRDNKDSLRRAPRDTKNEYHALMEFYHVKKKEYFND